ncbi:peptidoglycan-binding domain-containing protein [Paracoccus fistulariae]|uniref:Peptidoglycan-binding protein n=1 Tax=Paracoccus fistulariae TaxID=658446 RepID=A0ABY7SN12_9RHOB|nr:peptidoglycan-binding domain-containing protein [Paracoccus fistulariae]MDB6180115.1 peptidoglycan-binding domain-containing protein [Paracoccus fistulariae]WCR08201.1 peptidoglycan-binding protein [Paracoccus fistulariae]
MRHLAVIVVAAALPMAAFAQDAVIRIEAKRGAQAAADAAAEWGQKFDNVVTFPLAQNWIAIALGPLSEAEAAAQIQQLKAAGSIPGDSFVAVPRGNVTLTTLSGDSAPTGEAVEAAEEPSPETAEAPPAPPPVPPGAHIRLQAVQGEAAGQAALATWRERFADAGLWSAPGGWYVVTLGPMPRDTADVWLSAFKRAGDVPRDAFIAASEDLSAPVDVVEGEPLPAPDEPRDMPPLDEVQRALRWAGRYGGAIDGKDGPRTQEAIAAEVAGSRLSADPGTAMARLIDRRAEWRDEMGLSMLTDEATGLSLIAPMDRLEFGRAERALSIYRPKDESGAALILFSQPGGQQELVDLSGLVTALGWVPQPDRQISNGHILLEGADDQHIGRAEGWVRDGRAEGFVVIWPAADAEAQARIAAEMSDSFTRSGPAQNDPTPVVEGQDSGAEAQP